MRTPNTGGHKTERDIDHMAALRQAVAADPGDFTNRFDLAEALRVAGDCDALRHFRLAYAIASLRGPVMPAVLPAVAPLWAELAAELAQAGRCDEARQVFGDALAQWPDSPATLGATMRYHLPGVPRALGRLLVDLGRPADAAEFLALACASTPDDTAALVEVGTLHMDIGRPAAAVPWYRRAVAGGADAEHRLREALCRRGPAHRFRQSDGEPVGDERLLDALHRLPFAEGSELFCGPLTGGFHNAVYKVSCGDRHYALRLEKFPAARWDYYAEERANAVIAHAAGVAPPVIFFDTADGTALTGFIDGSPLGYDTFRDHRLLARAGSLYRHLHASPPFHGEYDIFRMIDLNVAQTPSIDDPQLADLPRLAAGVDEIRQLLLDNGMPAASCHNDPVPQNFIDTGDGLVLLDWQCSAHGDPHWELGAFSAQLGLTPGQEEVFLTAYFGQADHPGVARARLYKVVCHYYWLRRHMAKAADGPAIHNDAGKLRAMLADPALPALLETVRGLRWPAKGAANGTIDR